MDSLPVQPKAISFCRFAFLAVVGVCEFLTCWSGAEISGLVNCSLDVVDLVSSRLQVESDCWTVKSSVAVSCWSDSNHSLPSLIIVAKEQRKSSFAVEVKGSPLRSLVLTPKSHPRG